MRIAIDYTAAAQRAGIGRYTRELVRALLATDHGHDVRLVTGRDQSGEALAPRAQLPLSIRLQTILWQRLRVPLPAEWLIGEFDLFMRPTTCCPHCDRRAVFARSI
jgi:glycosyltransferase involved in cell wall biosynthesis